MDRLRTAPDERVDNVHLTTLQNGVESLARSLVRLLAPTGTGGSGILAGTPAYDSGTQRVTVTGLVALDGAGNVVLPTGAIVSDPIAGGDIGASGLFVWAVVVPGSVQSSPGKRVRWASGAPQSFSTNTKLVDSIQLVVAAAQPAALTVTRSSGVESYSYFKAFEITAWDGGVPNLPTFGIVAPWALGGTTAPGSVLGAVQLLAAAVGGIKSSGGAWNDTIGADVTLDGLDGRIVSLVARAVALETERITLPLSGHFHVSGGASAATMSASGILLSSIDAGSATVYIDFSPHYKSTLSVGTAVVTYSAGTSVSFVLVRIDATSGAETKITDTASAAEAAGETRAVLDVSGSHLVDLSDGVYRAKFTFSKAGGGGTAVIHFGSVNGVIAP